MSDRLVLCGIALTAISGVPGLFMGRKAAAGQWLSIALMALGAGLGLGGAILVLAGGTSPGVSVAWPVPGGQFAVGVDALSAVFLAPIFLILGLGSIYGLGYWKQAEHPDNGRKLRLFYGTLAGSMALLCIARSSVLFLLGWEGMALSAFFLVTTEDQHEHVRQAGWLYLLATHVGTLCLFALFGLLRALTGSFALTALQPGVAGAGMTAVVFLLALVAFGLKAGVMPLHVWLPSAHANAPSHVSAAMSGVLLKMGIYGLVRVCSLLPQAPLFAGALLLLLGVVSGVLGVVCAIGQHDLKRLLAYHSIENIGIILIGLGLALLGRSLGRADLLLLGLSGALLHVWNHGLFKSLLFLSAGSVIHATHTREIDLLGGLGRRMPRTALGFLVGAVAICGLPPLNGFVSELLIYVGLFRSVSSGPWLAAVCAAPALALIGGLAAACFVKVFGAVFLGQARSAHGAHAREAPPSMLLPMAALGLCCVVIGVAPGLVAPALERAALAWAPDVAQSGLGALAPLSLVTWMGLLLLGLLLVLGLALARRARVKERPEIGTWDCGYAAPAATMQYTSSSFAQILVDLFAFALRPQEESPPHKPLFPREGHYHSHVPDTVLESAILPVFRAIGGVFARLRFVQQGSAHAYLLYLFAGLVGLLLWLNLDYLVRFCRQIF